MTQAEEFYRNHNGLPEFDFPVLAKGDYNTIFLLEEFEKEIIEGIVFNTNVERELDRIAIENERLRIKLNSYIEHKDELIHITMVPKKWKLFCKWLQTLRKDEKD